MSNTVMLFNRFQNLVLAEPSFAVVTNPLQNYHPFEVNFLGEPMDGINFNLGPGTEAYFGCTAVFKGETIVFGGKKEPQQVSLKINNWFYMSLCLSSAKLNRVD